MAEAQDRTGLNAVAAAAEAAQESTPRKRGLPPVHLWNPPNVGTIDIRIRKDGSWVHEGALIAREALVRLFSTILRKDPDGHYLVTPHEKLKIVVEDAPFVAVRVDRVGEDLVFLTNVGDEVTAGPEHPLRVETDAAGEPRPYLRVRGELDALVTRAAFYDLVELADERAGADGEAELGVASGGAWFPIGRSGAAA
jgi:hypothetical protein